MGLHPNTENAWTKARAYLFGAHDITHVADFPDVNCYRIVSYTYSFNSLLDLYTTGSFNLKYYTNYQGYQCLPDGYSLGNKTFYPVARKLIAYQMLGRVCHLLADMSVPAHVHNHAHPCETGFPDIYENWIAGLEGVSVTGCSNSQTDFPAMHIYSGDDGYFSVGLLTNLSCVNDYDLLRYLFYTMNQLTDFSPSTVKTPNPLNPFDTKLGDNVSENIPLLVGKYAAWGTPPTSVCKECIAEKTLNYCISYTASLLYWFASKTGQLNTHFSTNPDITLDNVITDTKYITTASNSIHLTHGFRYAATTPQHYFHAYIQDCSSFWTSGQSSKVLVNSNINNLSNNTNEIPVLNADNFQIFPDIKSGNSTYSINENKNIKESSDALNIPKSIKENLSINDQNSEINSQLTNFNIYPNPSTGKFFVVLSGNAQPFNLEIINYTGCVLLKQTNLLENTLQVNLIDLPKGIYFVRVCAIDKQFNKKIVVQ